MPEIIDITGWPVWLVALLLALNLLKQPLANLWPQLFGFLIRQAETEHERRMLQADYERQDDITLWSSMVQLQSEAIRQNEKLLDFIISRLDTRLTEIAQGVREELRNVRQELSDISQRWLSATKELSQSKSQAHLLTIEITKLVDRMERIEKTLLVFGEAK